MKLTSRQEQLVHAFLRESGQAVQGLSPAAQAQTLSQVRRRLRHELQQIDQERVPDEQLTNLLDRLRIVPGTWKAAGTGGSDQLSKAAPRPEAPRKAAETRRKPRHPFASSRREWLGVCLNLAEQSGYPATAVRTGFVIGGVLTGPIAVLVYLGLYVVQYRSTREAIPRIKAGRLWRVAGGTVATLVGLFVLTRTGFWAIDFAYERLIERPLVPGIWGNFRDSYASAFVAAALVLVPFAVLASLPLAHDWDQTLGKVIKAGLALFALVVCFGIASYIAGALITGAQVWAG